MRLMRFRDEYEDVDEAGVEDEGEDADVDEVEGEDEDEDVDADEQKVYIWCSNGVAQLCH